MERLIRRLSFVHILLLKYVYISECAKFNKNSEGVEMQNSLLVVSLRSSIACASLCDERSDCISYSFTTSAKTCKINDNDPANGNVITVPESKLYIKGCETGWNAFNFSCYLISTTKMSWDSSQVYCESLGATLSKVENDEEHQFIRQTIPSKYFWIGAKYSDTAGEHRWFDGSEMTFNGWSPGKPGLTQGCVDYSVYHDLFWNSHGNCNEKLRFICEKRR